MSDHLNIMGPYRGYKAKVAVSVVDWCLHGIVMGIRDTIPFDGNCLNTLNISFEIAIDEYYDFCKKIDKQPNEVDEIKEFFDHFDDSPESMLGVEYAKKCLEYMKVKSPLADSTEEG